MSLIKSAFSSYNAKYVKNSEKSPWGLYEHHIQKPKIKTTELNCTTNKNHTYKLYLLQFKSGSICHF